MVPLRRPQLWGIVNITQDSFSDGGKYLNPEAARAHAHNLSKAGADVVDLGPASSHPDAAAVAPSEEIARLAPVLPALLQAGLVCSVDSFHTATQRWALGAGAPWLNDIQGFADASFYEELAGASCGLVVMHNIVRHGKAQRRKVAADKIYDEVASFFEERLAALARAGIAHERIVLDPGMGFFLSLDPAPSLKMLAVWPRLRETFGAPVLLSLSRKSFVWKYTGRALQDAAPVSLAAELHAAVQGVDHLRTHDVAQLNDALKLWQAAS